MSKYEKLKDLDLIKVAEAAHILGFKQRKKVDSLIEKGHLKTHCKKNSKLIWLSRTEVFNLPEPLPVPPSPDLLNQINEKSTFDLNHK
jgi:hypothetical protein